MSAPSKVSSSKINFELILTGPLINAGVYIIKANRIIKVIKYKICRKEGCNFIFFIRFYN